MRIVMGIVMVSIVMLGGCVSQNKKAWVPESAGKQIDSLTWDFGFIKQNILAKHVFQITNSGLKTLTIKDVTTSCGCTASEISTKILAPGESAFVAVTFNSKGYKGETSQFVYVNTDDPDKPLIKFTIKAYVQ